MKIAVIQNKWCERAEENFEHVTELVHKLLQKEKVDFLMLPEFFNGPAWFQPGQAHLKGVTDDDSQGRISRHFCSIAKQYNTNIIMGTIVERNDQKYQNTSIFINQNGEILGKSRKLHLFAGEALSCKAGTEICTYGTDYGAVGIAVCSDFWIVETMKILALKGAKIIFIPGGTLRQNIDPMIAALRSCAYLTSTIVVYASPVGRIEGRRDDKVIEINNCGTSLVTTPERLLVTASPDDEETLLAEIPDNYLDEYRANTKSEVWEKMVHQKQDTFKELLCL